MELSKRLQAVANLVSDGVSVVDVGTDHGYIPIYLLESQKTSTCHRQFHLSKSVHGNEDDTRWI